MITMNSQQLLELFAQTMWGADQFEFCGIATDSRKSCQGALFIALKGKNFDAHDYLQQAMDQGAVALLVEHALDLDIPQIVVKDTLWAMARLANYWRHQVNPKVIAITGSNGKTTVKEMLSQILQAKAPVLTTPGNFNNAIGVPLTLFGLSRNDEFAVVEMGANHAQEIAQLVACAEPDVVYVNNARAAHLQGFGSLQGVIHAKGEIYQYANKHSVAIFNEDEEACEYWKSIATSSTRIGFSLQQPAEVKASMVTQKNGLELKLEYQHQQAHTVLDVQGEHNAQNAAAAITLALACGVTLTDACAALNGFSGVSGRQQFLIGVNQSRIIDDSYNANPDSLNAAIKVLCVLDGKAWLALGDMAEMGDESLQLHLKVLQHAKQSGVEQVFAIGDMSCQAATIFDDKGHCFQSHEDMANFIAPRLTPDVNLLVKGSRSARMEKLVDRICQDTTQPKVTGDHHAV